MLRFVVRRLLLLVPILIGVSILVFAWIRALPGSPAESLLGERATPQAIAQIHHQYGLDQPVYVQYWDYVKTIGSGNLGTSIASPFFFLGLILKYVFAVRLHWLPSIGREDVLAVRKHPTNFYLLDAIVEGDPGALWDTIKHLILPAIALGSIPLAIITRITRA